MRRDREKPFMYVCRKCNSHFFHEIANSNNDSKVISNLKTDFFLFACFINVNYSQFKKEEALKSNSDNTKNKQKPANKIKLKCPDSSEEDNIESPKMDSCPTQKFYGRDSYGGLVDMDKVALNSSKAVTATKEATVTDNTYNLRNGASSRAKREPEGSLCKM